MSTRVSCLFLFALPASVYKEGQCYLSVYKEGQCYLYVGVLSVYISLGEVREVAEVQEEGPRPVSLQAASGSLTRSPGEDSRPLG